MDSLKVLALTKYGDRAASTRQRLLQFRPYLQKQGITIECRALLDNQYVESLETGRKSAFLRTATSYASRLTSLVTRRDFDVLWVHKELFPYLGGWAERLAFLPGKPVVYDFDDAIFHTYDCHSSMVVRTLLGRKLEPLLRRVTACSCGNAYLQSYASRFCADSIVIPTVVDTTKYNPVQPHTGEQSITVGWIGSPSTWTYVDPLLQLLDRVVDELGVEIRIVGAGRDVAPRAGFAFVPWSEDSEVAELQRMDIGIMPLADDRWARGKCGYKLIQYMACGLPVIATPVGVNTSLIVSGVNGFLAASPEQWFSAIARLVESRSLRQTLGAEGRKMVEATYSLNIAAPQVESVIRFAAGKSPLGLLRVTGASSSSSLSSRALPADEARSIP